MFSVNVDKLIKMSEREKDCYQEALSSIEASIHDEVHSLALIGGGLASFKLASAFANTGKKILFIDADLEEDVFLGKYKLGKNLKGFADYIREQAIDESFLCYTNYENINIIFTGESEKINAATDLDDNCMDTLFQKFKDQYDMIILQSDQKGYVAKHCDASVLMMNLEEYSEIAADIKVSELKNNGCYVLGVIINE